jgi:hypothetical protein
MPDEYAGMFAILRTLVETAWPNASQAPHLIGADAGKSDNYSLPFLMALASQNPPLFLHAFTYHNYMLAGKVCGK